MCIIPSQLLRDIWWKVFFLLYKFRCYDLFNER